MAVCYQCKNDFLGNFCSNCGWRATYKCWFCGSIINPKFNEKHKNCGWFICGLCKKCGCNPVRPMSNAEKKVWTDKDREIFVESLEKVQIRAQIIMIVSAISQIEPNEDAEVIIPFLQKLLKEKTEALKNAIQNS